MTELVKILPHQSLFDIALQEYGTIEAVIDVALSNDIATTDALTPGNELKLSSNTSINQDILNYYKQHNLQPATDTSSITDVAILQIIEDGNTEDYNLFYLLLGADNTSALLVDDDTYLLTI